MQITNFLPKSAKGIAAAIALGLASTTAQAVFIDFSTAGAFDPLIAGYQFSAGDFSNWEDTWVDDALSSGDNYLNNGWDSYDLVGNGTSTTLVKVAGAAVGGTGFDVAISLDAAFLSPLPGGQSLNLDVLSGGAIVATDAFTTTGSDYLSLTANLTDQAFDTLFIYDTADFGNEFRIDNLSIEVTDNTGGPGDPGNPGVPEPSTALLFGLGLLAAGRMSRRQR